ncbi:MAG: NAD(P)-dependent oxidoreductase [Archangium gephyra]|uniref:NAD(P)-dependent oxidoreductase n=1 Tax=Archangium gephyra TaxID=48 RepID=A0A2W5TSB6_9BACT|nr:MAG: NAD(P)-dependent oxidoreductase [Archangium gephyra]
MLVITGANGQLGQRMVHEVLKRKAASEVAVSVRDVSKAAALAALGVRVREGDFARPELLAKAFEGATRLLLVSSNARATGGDSVQQHRDVIAAAKQAGVERVLYTSHMAANANSRFKPMHDHAATEVLLAESGLKWTSLRHGFYATSALRMIEEGLKTGVIEAPANGVVSWTAHDDLAAGAASIACDENVIDGCTPPMTGPEALDARALAKLVSLDYREVSDEAFRAKGISFGLPPVVADIFLGMHQASRHGEFAEVNPFLEQRIGRKPLTVEQLLRARSSR